MPFVPPPPPNFKNQENTKVTPSQNVERAVSTKKQHGLGEKGKKILFSALAVLCFAAAIVMFTLMTVL